MDANFAQAGWVLLETLTFKHLCVPRLDYIEIVSVGTGTSLASFKVCHYSLIELIRYTTMRRIVYDPSVQFVNRIADLRAKLMNWMDGYSTLWQQYENRRWMTLDVEFCYLLNDACHCKLIQPSS